MKQLILITTMLLSLNASSNDWIGNHSTESVDIETTIDDCEDEVRIQHEGDATPHELIQMMFECRDELGQRK